MSKTSFPPASFSALFLYWNVCKAGNDQYQTKNQLRMGTAPTISPPTPRRHYHNQTNIVKDYTCEWPPPAPGCVTVRGAGCELGPGGKCAVILAGNEALLDEGRHRPCPPHAVTDGGRAALLRHARHSCKQRDTNLYILIYIYCITLQVVSPAALCEIHSPGLTE